MSYQIELEPSVHAELRRLPGYVRAQAITVIDQLGIDPRSTRAKELRDKPGIFRIWLAGRWRIVYYVDDARQLVTVLRVRLKDDIDYSSLA